MQDLKEVVRPFYTEILNVKGRDHMDVIERLIAEDFIQINTAETKDKSGFKTYVPGLFVLIPDLRCDIHTVENEQISMVYHLEEWTAAFRQLEA